MHFINGGRIYIKPDLQSRTLEQQLTSCLQKLEHLSLKKRIYKLNFFSDAANFDDYQGLKRVLEEKIAGRFPAPVLTSLIAQPPLTSLVLVEAFYFNAAQWNPKLHHADDGSAIVFDREGASVLVGQVQACSEKNCGTNAPAAFQSMHDLLDAAGFPLHTVIRQWNYIENILGYDGSRQRYQEFNEVRSAFYKSSFEAAGFPAATGIGQKQGGILIEFVAVNASGAVSLPIDNSQQVAAHAYSPVVLAGESSLPKSTPKFERARYLELFGRQQLFISGTASIRGEETAGIGNPEEQTRITIENIQRLYSDDYMARLAGNSVQPNYGHARVYIKNPVDFPVVKKTFKTFYGNLPVVYLQADVCRDDLLVEIEGKVILKRQNEK